MCAAFLLLPGGAAVAEPVDPTSPSTEETVELTLSPSEGAPGTSVTATVTGCSTDPRVSAQPVALQWDGAPLANSAGGFDVPDDAPPGSHSVTAWCGSTTAEADFTVVASQPPGPATLTLEPGTGSPGARVTLIGRDFFCDNDSRSVELVWDSGPLVADTATDERGEFRATVEVPPDAELGGRTVQASCTEGPHTATATFTVVADSTTTAAETSPPVTEPPVAGQLEDDPPVTGPPVAGPLAIEPPAPGSPIWLVVPVIIVAVVAAVAYWLKRRRTIPVPLERVHAEAHLGYPPEMSIRETPALGQRLLAVRLQVHADSGTQTIVEVDDDHTRP